MDDALGVASITTVAVLVAALRWPARVRRGSGLAAGWRELAAGAIVVSAAAAVLLAIGREPWYAHGPIQPWSSDIESDQQSQQVTDPYTFTHVTHGIVFYAALRALAPRLPRPYAGLLAIEIESVWEVVENTDAIIQRYRAVTIARGYYGDSVVNVLGDIAFTVIGVAIAARLPVPITVATTFLLEGVLVLLIRDSLFLNLLMLLAPIEAVRRWQQGA